MEWRSLGVSSP